MASENVHEFTDANFEAEVLQSDLPVLVDFWAEWCGPCRMIGPVIDEIAGETAGKLKVGKVDVDSNQGVAAQYGVQSIPTLKIFVGGEEKESLLGAQPKGQILAAVSSYLG